jgi:hypothetical protein
MDWFFHPSKKEPGKKNYRDYIKEGDKKVGRFLSKNLTMQVAE